MNRAEQEKQMMAEFIKKLNHISVDIVNLRDQFIRFKDWMVQDSDRASVFVEHIDQHLKEEPNDFEPDAKVICTICNKTIDEIYSEFKEDGEPQSMEEKANE